MPTSELTGRLQTEAAGFSDRIQHVPALLFMFALWVNGKRMRISIEFETQGGDCGIGREHLDRWNKPGHARTMMILVQRHLVPVG